MSDLIQSALSLAQQNETLLKIGGGYLIAAYHDLPRNLADIAGGNAVRAYAISQFDRLLAKGKARNDARGIESKPASASILMPILESAALEEREELLNLWEELIAAALDPARTNRMRYKYITILKSMDPSDALLFSMIDNKDVYKTSYLIGRSSLIIDEITVSVKNLENLGLLNYSQISFQSGGTAPNHSEFQIADLGISLRRVLGLHFIG